MTNDELRTLGLLMLGMSAQLLLACAFFAWSQIGHVDWSAPLTSAWCDDEGDEPRHMANPWTATVRAIEVDSADLRAWRAPRFVPSWEALEAIATTRALAGIEQMMVALA